MVLLGAKGFDANRWVFHPPEAVERLRTLKELTESRGGRDVGCSSCGVVQISSKSERTSRVLSR